MVGSIVNGRLLLAHDRTIPVQVKRSARARRMRLTLSREGELTATLPYGTRQSEMDSFIRSCLPWIERTLLKLSLQSRRRVQSPPVYPAEFVLPAVDETLPVRYEWKNVCWTGAKEADRTIQVTGKVLDPEQVHESLVRVLIRKAENLLAPMILELAEQYGFRVGKISFRFQRGRWGSCSRARDISLNAQLLFRLPEEVRYVMIHELCHTREMNHSARFWQEVAKYCPDHLRIRRNLKRQTPGTWY